MQFTEIGFELGIGEPVNDTAILHDVVTIRNRRGEAKILLDEQNCETLLLEQADGLADLLDDDWGKALGWLREQQKPGAGAQDTADGEHLLLTARQFCTLARQALLKIGKQLENPAEF